MKDYYILWALDNGIWRVVEITSDPEIISEFITETTYTAFAVERIDLEHREFPR